MRIYMMDGQIVVLKVYGMPHGTDYSSAEYLSRFQRRQQLQPVV